MEDNVPRTVLAIRHVAFKDLGSFESLFKELSFSVQYVDVGQPVDIHTEADLVVVLGGPISANDEKNYPFLRTEMKLLEHRLTAELPTIGICLGAQLIARVLGCRVYAAPDKELGWGPLQPTTTGKGTCIDPLIKSQQPVLHWHGDTFDLPEGATLLASTPGCTNQAFTHGRALALQFHPEVTPVGLEQWFVGHTLEIESTPGVTVQGLRASTRRFCALLEERGKQCLNLWLDHVGLR